ncbi:hypothetical protein BASA81_006504 [Batrachochytrium salamandrivorans]|nr:hypothetical protein BASA81_006504 [Batrachochytrium salamandrivorans]
MSDLEMQPAIELQPATENQHGMSWKRFSVYVILNLIVLGLVQLWCWLGRGLPDPFFPSPVTILQICGCIASLIQIVVFVPSFALQTERVYDVVGSLTYVVCLLYTLLTGMRVNQWEIDLRAVLGTCCALVWAVRLGGFLFLRRSKANVMDTRFTHLMPHFIRYLFVWNVQGLWVVSGMLPIFILNSTQNRAPFLATDAVGGVLFCCGLGLEMVADRQKSLFKANPANKGKWIDTGFWYYSRHPNYFFEWVVQLGLFLIAVAEFEGSQFVGVVGPVFVALLLWFLSGVPILERSANAKWANDEEYMIYRKRTSVCIPFFKFVPSSQHAQLSLPRRWIVADGFWDE